MHIQSPNQTQLEKFFTQCGELISSVTQANGVAPTRTFTQKFFYTRGQAYFDGKNWEIWYD